MSTWMVGIKYPMAGVEGGRDGAPNQLTVRCDTQPKRIDNIANAEPHAAGEAFEYLYGGGAGYGDPLLRDPAAVRDDVLDEYVSPEAAGGGHGGGPALGRCGAARPRGGARRRARRVRLAGVGGARLRRGAGGPALRVGAARRRRSDAGAGGAAAERARRRMSYRIGIDVGGTFTDFVLARGDGSLALGKEPTSWPDQSQGVLRGIARLAA